MPVRSRSKPRTPSYCYDKPRRFSQNDKWIMLYTRDCYVRVPLTAGDLAQCRWKVRQLDDDTYIAADDVIDQLIERIGLRVNANTRKITLSKASGFKQ